VNQFFQDHEPKHFRLKLLEQRLWRSCEFQDASAAADALRNARQPRRRSERSLAKWIGIAQPVASSDGYFTGKD
jgi:hypothetical protein